MNAITRAVLKKPHVPILILVILLAELIVWPVGEFPLNDDWSYTWSVKHLFQHGDIQIGAWPAMTLWSHLVWGLLFLKIFGFSFFILRLSTLIASFITLWLLFKLVKKKANPHTSLVAALTLLVCPIYFNLSNTYMTDITFMMLSLSAIYAAVCFFESGNFWHFFLVYVFSILLVLVRQYGIALPLAFTVACMFRRIPLRVSAVLMSIIGLIVTIAVLKFYESYLQSTLPPNSAYKFSNHINLFDGSIYDLILFNGNVRLKLMNEYLLVLASPFSLYLLPTLLRKYPLKYSITIFVMAMLLGWYYFVKIYFPLGNVFENMNVGTDTFYESLTKASINQVKHTYSAFFANLARVGGALLSGFTIAALLLSLPNLNNKKISANPVNVLLFCFFTIYMVLLLVTESFFDRYLLLPLVLLILLLANAAGFGKSNVPAILLLIGFFTFSTLGTRDYFVLNRLKWQVWHNTAQQYHVKDYLVNGGFEINSWDSGRYNHWMSFLNVKQYHYLIQYRKEPGFTPVKAYPFYRWLGCHTDTIKVFRNDSLVKP